MNFEQQIEQLKKEYSVLDVVELDHWHTMSYSKAQAWLEGICLSLHRQEYENDQRLIFVQRQGDMYTKEDVVGLILQNLQIIANEQDISNFFIILLSNNPNLAIELEAVKRISSDPVPITGIYSDVEQLKGPVMLDKHPGSLKETYQYGSANPIKINLNQLNGEEQFLLTESKVFCMYPWVHLHAWPTGQAFPCCMSAHEGQLGDCKTHTLEQIWNNKNMRQLRSNMLNEVPSVACERCYEQDDAGFFSGRKSANKHYGHHIEKIHKTKSDGTLDEFRMIHWDIRFSNLCNLSCRSCGHIFSSSWFQDQAKLAGGDWAKHNKPLNHAGRWETDMWEQLIPHLDYVEQIYFAGGEPLMMEEHYNILEELVRRERFDVRLIYNTNFTHIKLKDKVVFDYWKKFSSVAVGASLDAMGPRAEYIRRGTNWDTVERNREQMLKICPEVDFYISPTLSILNADHLPDFHKNWVDKELIRAQDLNVNILQDPAYYRIDIAPAAYKNYLREKFEAHIEWLRPLDHLKRATVGFESAVNFMMSTDNSHLISKFWNKSNKLDQIRKENLLEIIPELKALK